MKTVVKTLLVEAFILLVLVATPLALGVSWNFEVGAWGEMGMAAFTKEDMMYYVRVSWDDGLTWGEVYPGSCTPAKEDEEER